MRFLIAPNYGAAYDRRMVRGLGEGFRALGHEACPLADPLAPAVLAEKCRAYSIDVVIQVNRIRSPDYPLPPHVRHIAWYQDVFPETASGFAEGFRSHDILYALGDAQVLGLEMQLPCLVGSLLSGVDQAVFGYRPHGTADAIDFSLCGFIPPPISKRSALRRILQPHNPRLNASEIMIRTVTEHYRPLHGALDIHALAQAIRENIERHRTNLPMTGIRRLYRATSDAVRAAFAPPSLDGLSSFERSISYFTREYPRLLDRLALVESVLDISQSLELYGPGWQTHPQFRPYAKGVIDGLEQLLEVYCRSRINLANNTHGLGLHSRTLECMAVGGFILMHESPHDAKSGGMLTAFVPGEHYGSYTPDSLCEEAMRWLRNTPHRRQVGARAAEVVRRQHCWHHRAQQVIDDLGK